MKTTKVADLEVGNLPRVVGTISSIECLQGFASRSKDFCDIAEVRLDEILAEQGSFTSWKNSCREIENVGVPAMVTLRTRCDGGKCDRPNDERLEILKQALECASIVDVEYTSQLAAEIKPAVQAAGKALLVSYHNFSGTPSRRDLEQIIKGASAHADIVKVVTMVKDEQDLDVLREVLSANSQIPLCLIGMGAKGTCTRTSFPCFGSCLTYGYLDCVTAPGQLSAHHLVDHLRLVIPKYNEDFIIRHEIMEFV